MSQFSQRDDFLWKVQNTRSDGPLKVRARRYLRRRTTLSIHGKKEEYLCTKIVYSFFKNTDKCKCTDKDLSFEGTYQLFLYFVSQTTSRCWSPWQMTQTWTLWSPGQALLSRSFWTGSTSCLMESCLPICPRTRWQMRSVNSHFIHLRFAQLYKQ